MFQIGDWIVQPQQNLISCQETTIRLEPRVMALLVCLSENPGQVVSKDKLLETVWGDTFVTEQVLKVGIFELRKSLNDNARQPRYIQTVSKKGYRLAATVTSKAESLESEQRIPSDITLPTVISKKEPINNLRLKFGIILFLPIFVLVGIWIWTLQTVKTNDKDGSKELDSIVVLPLKNISENQTEEFFTNGLTESMTTEIAKINNLRVISVLTAMRYKNIETKPFQLSQELKVTKILEGSVMRSNGKIRLSVRLLNADNESSIWAKTYERDFADIFNLQNELAGDVAREINLKLVPTNSQNQPVNTQAYDIYLKGRFFWSKRQVENIEKSLKYFEEAIALDPNQALFYSGLADAYILLAFYSPTPDQDYYQKAKEAAQKALVLDNTLAEAHTSLAAVLHKHDLNWVEAEREFQKAIELNPNYPTAHQWYAIYLVSKGEYEKAVAEIDRALTLDPLSLILRTDRGWILYVCRRYDEAILQLRQTIELDPSFGAYYFLILAYAQNGMAEKGVLEAEAAITRKSTPEYVALLSYAQAKAGKIDASISNLQKLERTPRIKLPVYEMAIAYLAIGYNQKALELLEKVPTESSSWQAFLKTQPELDILRNEPRFQKLLSRIGF